METTTEKKLYIKTYGCQMNVYDSLKMKEILAPFGFKPTEDIEESDMVILNTCHIREKATEKVYSELGQIRDMKAQRGKGGKGLVTVVAGCVAQAEGEEIMKRSRVVDIVVGPQSLQNLPELLIQLERKNKGLLNLNFEANQKFDSVTLGQEPSPVSSFLTVQEGCDKFCKFCVVPYTRGGEFSRPVEDVYREALSLASRGAIEITLLGQNVSAYHGGLNIGDKKEVYTLAKLIEKIAKIPEIKRIRYTTSHPVDTLEDLIALHGTEEKLMPFLHLPIQSGSNKILKSMNRKHDRDFYLDIISKFRKARPDIAFSSDFIVGYPGETDKDFLDTVNLVTEIGYAQCYSFKYSVRPGTPASVMNQVDEGVKTTRIMILQDEINRQQNLFNEKFLGQEIEVLFDRVGKRPGQLIGKSPYMQSVYINDGESYMNTIQKVVPNQLRSNSLAAEKIRTLEAS
jgi:tRNA-2-methylthio-N6-dimethylallyladenosine synthase